MQRRRIGEEQTEKDMPNDASLADSRKFCDGVSVVSEQANESRFFRPAEGGCRDGLDFLKLGPANLFYSETSQNPLLSQVLRRLDPVTHNADIMPESRPEGWGKGDSAKWLTMTIA